MTAKAPIDPRQSLTMSLLYSSVNAVHVNHPHPLEGYNPRHQQQCGFQSQHSSPYSDLALATQPLHPPYISPSREGTSMMRVPSVVQLMLLTPVLSAVVVRVAAQYPEFAL